MKGSDDLEVNEFYPEYPEPENTGLLKGLLARNRLPA
jgi:hypothetical protein